LGKAVASTNKGLSREMKNDFGLTSFNDLVNDPMITNVTYVAIAKFRYLGSAIKVRRALREKT
jgi:hypothetical protein